MVTTMAVVLLLCFRVTSASDVPTQMSESSNQQPEPGNLISRASADGAIGRCRLLEKRSCFPEPRLGSGLALFPEISAKDSFRKAFFDRLQPPPLVMPRKCSASVPLLLDQQTKTTCTNLETHGGHHGTSFVSAKDTAPPRIHSVWLLADLLQNCLCCAIPLDGEKSLVASCFVKAKHCFMVSEGQEQVAKPSAAALPFRCKLLPAKAGN